MKRKVLEHEDPQGATGAGAEATKREEAAPAGEVRADDGLPWELLSWSGLPMWRCRACPWDTLEGEEAMIEHIEARHGIEAPAAAPAARLVQVYDAWGNPKP